MQKQRPPGTVLFVMSKSVRRNNWYLQEKSTEGGEDQVGQVMNLCTGCEPGKDFSSRGVIPVF